MIRAFSLAIGQLADGRTIMLWLKSMAVTLLLCAVIGWAAWFGLSWLLDAAIAFVGMADAASSTTGVDELKAALLVVLVLIGGWLIFRIVALLVLQFFADEVVALVEERHYPSAHARAKPLGWQQELKNGLKGGARALGYNLLALPFALLLIVTGVGPAILFGAVNAALIGRELNDMARLRHADGDGVALEAMPRNQRFLFGGIIVLLLAIPVINLFAPFIGAAMATHLVHRAGHATTAADPKPLLEKDIA